MKELMQAFWIIVTTLVVMFWGTLGLIYILAHWNFIYVLLALFGIIAIAVLVIRGLKL